MTPHRPTRREFLRGAGRSAGALAAALGVAPRCSRATSESAPAGHTARYWEKLEDDALQCTLCPHACKIAAGTAGKCRTRAAEGEEIVSLVYGKAALLARESIEQHGLFHVHPGSGVLTIGTAGCVLSCKYCSTYTLSQAEPGNVQATDLPPEQAIEMAQQTGCSGIVFSGNDPVVHLEYVIDVARLAREAGLFTAAHTSGFVNPEPLKEACEVIDVFNVDLKGFTESFYRGITGGKLAAVQEAIKTIREQDVWMEITNLVIPGQNDRITYVTPMCEWILQACGPDIPVHFSAFFPRYQLAAPAYSGTKTETLRDLRKEAYKAGLRYAYVGNVPTELPGQATHCPRCLQPIIQRLGNTVRNLAFNYKARRCAACNTEIPGVWSSGIVKPTPPPPAPPEPEPEEQDEKPPAKKR
ncbi:MAG: AmmeMemoRadiSam system radical SAM enzyme [Armatimonadota bacterium]|jgi:pyruvate formate lyase activating enzyme